MIRYGAAFIMSFVFALYWTPLMRKAALQLGIVDQPDGSLKKHDECDPISWRIGRLYGLLTDCRSFD